MTCDPSSLCMQQVFHWGGLVHRGHRHGSCCPHTQGSRLLGKAHCGPDQEHTWPQRGEWHGHCECTMYMYLCECVCMCVHVYVPCPALQRAPSAPCPAVPSRPSRSNIESGGTLPNNSAYAPLNMTSMNQPGLYQEVGLSASGGKRKLVQKQNSEGRSAPSGSSGVYQALVEPNKDAPSTYAVRHIDSDHGCIVLTHFISSSCRQSTPCRAREVGLLLQAPPLLLMPRTWACSLALASLPREGLMPFLIASNNTFCTCTQSFELCPLMALNACLLFPSVCLSVVYV